MGDARPKEGCPFPRFPSPFFLSGDLCIYAFMHVCVQHLSQKLQQPRQRLLNTTRTQRLLNTRLLNTVFRPPAWGLGRPEANCRAGEQDSGDPPEASVGFCTPCSHAGNGGTQVFCLCRASLAHLLLQPRGIPLRLQLEISLPRNSIQP